MSSLSWLLLTGVIKENSQFWSDHIFFFPIFAQSTLRQDKQFTEFTEILKTHF